MRSPGARTTRAEESMDGTIVYSKTPKGTAEVAARSAQLSMTARRILIMIDGKRAIDELLVLVRPGELEGIIGQLESSGLIQRASISGALDVPTINGRDAEFSFAPAGPNTGGIDEREGTSITLEEAKRRAVRELTDRLGPEAERLAIRLEQCRTIEEFRGCVREAERFVSLALGPAAAQEYVRALRRRS
jgi:hypothetical protein